MTDYQTQQLGLLRRVYGDLDAANDLVVLAEYPVPPEVWGVAAVEVCFRIPPEPATVPYGFWVRPQLIACTDVTPDDHYTCAQAPLGQGADWGFFSWSPMTWTPQSTILAFVRSFADRLASR